MFSMALWQAQVILQEVGDKRGETKCLIELANANVQCSRFSEAVGIALQVIFCTHNIGRYELNL